VPCNCSSDQLFAGNNCRAYIVIIYSRCVFVVLRALVQNWSPFPVPRQSIASPLLSQDTTPTYIEHMTSLYCSFFKVLGVGWDRVHLVRRALFGLLYQHRKIDDDERGAVGGMRIGKGNRCTSRKPTPVPLCPSQIPHDLTGREPGPLQWETGDKPP
jgi:hypothetical protein